MGGAVPVNVVDLEELELSLTTACTLAAVRRHGLGAQPSPVAVLTLAPLDRPTVWAPVTIDAPTVAAQHRLAVRQEHWVGLPATRASSSPDSESGGAAAFSPLLGLSEDLNMVGSNVGISARAITVPVPLVSLLRRAAFAVTAAPTSSEHVKRPASGTRPSLDITHWRSPRRWPRRCGATGTVRSAHASVRTTRSRGRSYGRGHR